jgi:serine/threonine protein kinase
MSKENLSDFDMDIKSFHEIKSLGSGSFGTVKLMKDIRSQQFVVKHFGRGILRLDETSARVFSRELEAFYHLNHPYVTRVYRFSRDIEDYEGALVMEYMSNGHSIISLNKYEKEIRQISGMTQELRPLFAKSLLEWNSFTHEAWFIAI